MRLVLVFLIIIVGGWYALSSPFYALLFYLWVAYFRPENWVYSSNVILANLSFAAGAWTLLSTAMSGRLRLTGAGPILAFLLLTLAGVLFSPVGNVALGGWIEFAKPAVISCLIIALVDSVARLRWALLAICFSLSFEGAKQGWAELLRHPGGLNTNTLPMFGDNNGVALGMLVVVSLLVALARTATTRQERWVEQFLAVGVLYRALSTYSRGGFLAALALGLHFFWRSKYRVRAAIATVLLVVAAYTVLPEAFWDRMHTIDDAAQSPGEVDTSVAGRFHFWAVALDIANSRPLTGTGIATYPAVYDQYDTSGGMFGNSRATHSSWFGLLAEVGYLGFGLFLTTLLMAAHACRVARRVKLTTPEAVELKAFGAGLEGGLLVTVVAGSFLSFQYAEIWWHIMALSLVAGRLARQISAAPDVATTGPTGRSGPMPRTRPRVALL